MPAPRPIDPNLLHVLFTYDPTAGALIPKQTAYGAARRVSAYQWRINGDAYSTHRLIWAYHNPTDANPPSVEFIDGDRRNQRIENLQALKQNPGRFRSNGAGKALIPGLHYNPQTQKIDVAYHRNGQINVVGSFDTSAEAAQALRAHRDRRTT